MKLFSQISKKNFHSSSLLLNTFSRKLIGLNVYKNNNCWNRIDKKNENIFHKRRGERFYCIQNEDSSDHYLWMGKEEKEKGDFLKAKEHFEKSSDKEALFHLGMIHFEGLGIEKDIKKGIEYFEKAAEMGELSSINNLIHIYFEGKNGVPVNSVKGIHYLELSASYGVVNSINNLGVYYLEGKHVPKNFKKALHYFKEGQKVLNLF